MSEQSTLRGVLCMVGGCALLTLNDALIKWVTAAHPVGEAIFVRGVFTMIPIALLAQRAGGASALRVVRWKGQLARAAATVLSTFMFIFSLQFLPLADAIAITFAGPIILTALAPWLLAEHVGWRRWAAVSVGFVGVLLMVKPGGDAFQWAALLALGVAFVEALRDVITRRMVSAESTVSMLFLSSTAVTVSALFTLLGGWSALDRDVLVLLALAGCLMGGAHFLMIEAFRHAEAVTVSAFRYSSVVWAVLLGALVWGHLPDTPMMLGAALVVGSGLFILHRETKRRAEPARD